MIELVAAIPTEALETLSAEQIGLMLAVLRPLEAIADELREAARARMAPAEHAAE